MLRSAKTHAFSTLFAALLVAATPGLSHADEYSDVSALIRTGKFVEAVAFADKYLAGKPRDAQMRFSKGVALTELNKTAEAIALFTKLTEDYPELPEPYNNLAVLYASSSQFDKARAALEMAIRTHPSYATAHENLGDVYAKLAQAAYTKALNLDQANNGAQGKLTIIRDMFTSKSTPVAVGAVAAVAAVATPAVSAKPAGAAAPIAPPPGKTVPAAAVPAAVPAPPPAVLAVAPTPPAVPAAKPPVAAPPDATAPPAVVAAPPAVAVAAVPPVKAPPPPAAAGADEKAAVMASVQSWAKAWSNKDVKAYLAAYGRDFAPSSGSRSAWETERRARIEGKGRISVGIEQPEVSISGDTATVRFRQEYESDRLSSSSRKTLVLTRAGAGWQIKQESSGK